MAFRHPAAMPDEVMQWLACEPGQRVADCTLGGAGHARRICHRIGPNGLLVGIDRDPAAIANGRQALGDCPARIRLVQANFAELPQIIRRLEVDALDGILLDLGLSLDQLEASGRGFSFQRDEPLDMRMDPSGGATAADVVQQSSAAELAQIFKQYGEERFARPIARRIVKQRVGQPIHTSAELAHLVCQVVPRRSQGRIHPATRVFMALRIAVNQELENLRRLLEAVPTLLRSGGRICVLAFHSLEDRIVKQQFRALASPCTCPPTLPVCSCGAEPTLRLLTRRPVRPTPEEVAANPLSRSTLLRAAERI